MVAIKTELDAWITSGRMRVVPTQKRWTTDRTNRTGAMFLLVDSEIALTFARLALEAKNGEKRRHTTQVARKAHDTITRLREGINLSDSERSKLDTNLQRLKSELESLGQTF